MSKANLAASRCLGTFFFAAQNVCFWHKADIATVLNHVRFRGTSVRLVAVSAQFTAAKRRAENGRDSFHTSAVCRC
jgi:hypothetical protein